MHKKIWFIVIKKVQRGRNSSSLNIYLSFLFLSSSILGPSSRLVGAGLTKYRKSVSFYFFRSSNSLYTLHFFTYLGDSESWRDTARIIGKTSIPTTRIVHGVEVSRKIGVGGAKPPSII